MFLVKFLICLLGLFGTLVFALTTDNKEKLHIISDTSIYNYKTGINIFEGHVQVDQGTTHITAEKLTTKTNGSHKVQEVIAYGNQELAHYWTLPKLNKPEMHAHANVIKYYPIASNVAMEGKVFVTQEKNSFQGELVLYSMNDQTITVPAASSSRSILIYNPDETT